MTRRTRKSKLTSVAVDSEQYDQLQEIANTPPRESVSALVRRILHEYLSRRVRHHA